MKSMLSPLAMASTLPNASSDASCTWARRLPRLRSTSRSVPASTPHANAVASGSGDFRGFRRRPVAAAPTVEGGEVGS
jgi:hypothetical protein